MGLLNSKLKDKEPIRILIYGLSGAGKTTILNRLNPMPTPCNSTKCILTEMGSNDYDKTIQGIIFVVDSTDREHIQDAKEKLHDLVKRYKSQNVVFMIMANKQDMSDAMTAYEISYKLEMKSLENTWQSIQSTCALEGNSIKKEFKYLVGSIQSVN